MGVFRFTIPILGTLAEQAEDAWVVDPGDVIVPPYDLPVHYDFNHGVRVGTARRIRLSDGRLIADLEIVDGIGKMFSAGVSFVSPQGDPPVIWAVSIHRIDLVGARA